MSASTAAARPTLWVPSSLVSTPPKTRGSIWSSSLRTRPSPAGDVVLLGAQVSWLVPVIGLSLVAGAIAFVAGIQAARLLGAKIASFLGLTEVLFAVVFAWILLGQSLTAPQLLGGLLVVAGIALVRLDEVRSGGPETPASPDETVLTGELVPLP